MTLIKDHDQPPHKVLALRKSAIVVVALRQAAALYKGIAKASLTIIGFSSVPGAGRPADASTLVRRYGP